MASLKGSLSKFLKQQEKCQSSLSSIAAKAKLRIPIGAQIKRVLDFLRETRQELTAEEIIKECNVDKSTIDNLKKNPKLNYNRKFFSYKAKYDVRDDDELFNLIRKYPDGIIIADLMDAYPNVADDLESLKAERKILVLTNTKKQEIAYPSDPKVAIKLDDDLKMLFNEIELPQDMLEIQDDLKKKGMKPATDTAKRRAMAQAHGVYLSDPKPIKRKGEITKRTKLTNAHLPELFFKNT